MIKIVTTFPGKKGFDDLIRYIENIPFVKIEAEVTNLAEDAIEVMKNKIDSSRKRPDKGTHNLENSIDVKELINDPGIQLVIGVGEVAKMLKEAPYFEVLDVGGYIPPANLGYFGEGEPPVAGGNGQSWTHTGSKSDFLMTPKSPIEGISYIQDGLNFIRKNMDKMLKEFGATILDGMTKASK